MRLEDRLRALGCGRWPAWLFHRCRAGAGAPLRLTGPTRRTIDLTGRITGVFSGGLDEYWDQLGWYGDEPNGTFTLARAERFWRVSWSG
jgi:hypothetical protein